MGPGQDLAAGVAQLGRGFDAADAEVQAHGLGRLEVLLERGPGKGSDVGVAAGIDHGLGADGGESGLIGQHHAVYAAVGAEHVGDDGVVEHARAGLAQEAVGLQFETLDVEADIGAVHYIAHLSQFGIEAEAGFVEVACGVGAGGAAHEVEGDATDHGQARAQIGEAVEGGAHHIGDVAAGVPGAFHYQSIGTAAGGGDGGDGAGTAASDDEHIGLGDYGEGAIELHAFWPLGSGGKADVQHKEDALSHQAGPT